MTEEIKKEVKKIQEPEVLCIGMDVGTGNFACSRSDSDEIKIMRNVFLKVDKDDIDIGQLSNINYIKDSDENVFIIGQDAFQFCNIMGNNVSRPMAKGVISAKEIDAVDILTMMVKQLIGDTTGKTVNVIYSIPAEALDEEKSILYHEKTFSRIFSSLGYKSAPLNEGLAIIYSECEKENFTGIGISFGAGMCNTCCAFKGAEAAKFSTARSGDWIDLKTAESLNLVVNRVTSIKEKYLNLETGFLNEKDKKRRRILESLNYYYESLIQYTIKKLVKEFETNIDLEIDHPIPIVLAGGTSSVPGFLELFKSTISKYELPFEISEIRMAKSPLTAVSSGLLIKALSDI